MSDASAMTDADLQAEMARRETARQTAVLAAKRGPLEPLKSAFVDDEPVKLSDLVAALQAQRMTMTDDLWPHANAALLGLSMLQPILAAIFTDPIVTPAPMALLPPQA